MGYFRTAILLAALTALFMALGFAIGGQTGMVIAFLFAAGMNLFAYWNSDKVVLSMYGAHPVDARSAPELYQLVERLAHQAALPMPNVFIIDNPQPNAFATGRNPEHAAVAVTTGILHILSPEELAGVISHELAHIKHRDTLLMTVTATIAGAISMVANFGLFFGGVYGDRNNNGLGIIGSLAMMILAPIAAAIVQMAISRTREYEADRLGAEICQAPLWLASALHKISGAVHEIPNLQAERNPASAPLFIINPLSGARMDNLFSTHPAVENRIAKLKDYAKAWGETRGIDDLGTTIMGGARSGRIRPAASEPSGPWGPIPDDKASSENGQDGPWGRGPAQRGPWG